MSSNSLASKDSALRAVGRTVVNFQKLEYKLKLAARLGPVQGTLPKIKRDVERQVERAETLTLGQAIQCWLGVFEEEPKTKIYTPDLFDATMQMTFALEVDAEIRSAHAADLKSLLDTRNKLIHGSLVQFQWDSPEECDRLVRELEEVNEVIGSQLRYINSIFDTLREMYPRALETAYAEIERQFAVDGKPAVIPNSSLEHSRDS